TPSRRSAPGSSPSWVSSRSSRRPSQTLQQTGHASNGHPGFDGPSRVRRLLSVAFGGREGIPMTLTVPLMCTLLVGAAAGADEPARKEGGAPKGRLLQVKLAGRELVWNSYVKETCYKEVLYTKVDPKTGRETVGIRRVPYTVNRSIIVTCPAT